MTLYVIICIDKPDALYIRMATRDAHLAYVKETQRVRFQVGGPFLSENGAMIGSMLIVEAATRAAVDAFIADDPYGKAGLFACIEMRPWKITVGTLGNQP